MPDLDNTDRKIIRALRRDGRMTNVALAGEVGLSPSACLRRVQILEESGVIRGYTAIVAGAEGREGHVVIVRISLERQTEDVLRRFEAEVLKHPEIRECYLMTGEEDYLLRLEAAAREITSAFTRRCFRACRASSGSIRASPSAAFSENQKSPPLGIERRAFRMPNRWLAYSPEVSPAATARLSCVFNSSSAGMDMML